MPSTSLTELLQMIDRLNAVREPEPHLIDEGLQLADELQKASDRSTTDLAVLHAVGWLHWTIFLLSPAQNRGHLTSALRFFRPVYYSEPNAVPEPVRRHFVFVSPLAVETQPQAAKPNLDVDPELGAHDVDALASSIEGGDPSPLIDIYEHAVSSPASADTHRAKRFELVMYLLDLNDTLKATLSASDDPEILDSLIRVREGILRFESESTGLMRAWPLFQLSAALWKRFTLRGVPEDLNRAIELAEQGVEATPKKGRAYAGYLSNLGILLSTRFEATGHRENLDRSIDLAERAVTAADPLDRASFLPTLGGALLRRFQHFGALEDANRGIQCAEETVDATGDGPRRSESLSNLGAALYTRFTRSKSLEDLDRAVLAGQEAVGLAPKNHPKRAGYLANLGNSLHARFRLTGDPEDADLAISACRKAVELTPESHIEKHGYLSNLSIALCARFNLTGIEADIDEAIKTAELAVETSAEDDPRRAANLVSLGNALLSRFVSTLQQADGGLAAEAFREATTLKSAPSEVRAQAALGRGRLGARRELWHEAIEGYAAAVDLLGLVASPELGRSDQEFRLGDVSGVGSEAAAACVQAGQPGRAVELFEQGRAVLFSRVLNSRSDLTDLQRAHPDLAQRFIRWRDVLDRPDLSPSGLAAEGGAGRAAARMAGDRRREAAAGLEEVLAEIRNCVGFEGFLLPRPVEELLEASEDGPVVLLNVDSLRSDALILTPDGIDVLPLDGVGPEEVGRQLNAFLDALDAGSEAALAGVLAWLGERVTGPVLDHLGYTGAPAPGKPWPRVWWCPSGSLSLLPFHAAGHHDADRTPPDAVIDRVVSSTVPTVRALLRARQAPLPTREPRLLVVAMPHTPGQADLPGVYREADTLRGLYAGQVEVLGLPGTGHADYETVMAALPGHPWVHFSCHGESDLSDPSSSHLLLTDYQTRPLTVLDLTGARLQDGELAFLSACSTARTGTALPDEPIHLAAACQLAGYRHVIASLWPIGDAETAQLTKDFYKVLATMPGIPHAVALHLATRRLRAIYRDRPSRWAPYTHTGP